MLFVPEVVVQLIASFRLPEFHSTSTGGAHKQESLVSPLKASPDINNSKEILTSADVGIYLHKLQ